MAKFKKANLGPEELVHPTARSRAMGWGAGGVDFSVDPELLL